MNGLKNKTKKNGDKKQKQIITPLISPNVLKNKLLKRIKEHKQRETENLENNKKSVKNNVNENEIKAELNVQNNDINSFSDEFSDSLKYLQTLTEDRKNKDNKANYEINKQKRKENLERRTVKNHQSLNQSTNEHPGINIELPEELYQPLIHINTDLLSLESEPNTPTLLGKDTPYGILKNGTKPTYRDWSKTQRNNIVTNPNLALTIQGSEIYRQKNEREQRLNNLRQKLKMKHMTESIQKDTDIMMSSNLIANNGPILDTVTYTNITNNITPLPDFGMIQPESPICIAPNEVIIAIKKITKKTIKRKYTLGKSRINKTVSVLIKDRGTRKRILDAQKELKKKSINNIKTYLREHNLIKIGSNAPNDVIRKMYESSMLAGEIVNSNAETLLHNFSKDDKEF
jgi:hypothetical protein